MSSAWGQAWSSNWGVSWNILPPPLQLEQLPYLVAGYNTGTYTYALSAYFAGAASYSVSPALPSGFSLNTATGVLSINSAAQAAGTYGPFTFSATNSAGTINGNAVTIKLVVSDRGAINANPF